MPLYLDTGQKCTMFSQNCHLRTQRTKKQKGLIRLQLMNQSQASCDLGKCQVIPMNKQWNKTSENKVFLITCILLAAVITRHFPLSATTCPPCRVYSCGFFFSRAGYLWWPLRWAKGKGVMYTWTWLVSQVSDTSELVFIEFSTLITF
jgi:hypothetical protein